MSPTWDTIPQNIMRNKKKRASRKKMSGRPFLFFSKFEKFLYIYKKKQEKRGRSPRDFYPEDNANEFF